MDNTYFERERPENVIFRQKIQVNQLGYKTYGEKRAVIAKPCDSFIICDKSRKALL